MVGEPAKAISLIENALRLNPFPSSWYFLFLGAAYRLLGRYEEAIQTLKKAIDLEPRFLMAHLALGVAYVLDGRQREACAVAEEVVRIDPKFSLEHYAKVLPFKDQAERDRIIAALRKAGLKRVTVTNLDSL
jgi:adenylate cyclase